MRGRSLPHGPTSRTNPAPWIIAGVLALAVLGGFWLMKNRNAASLIDMASPPFDSVADLKKRLEIAEAKADEAARSGGFRRAYEEVRVISDVGMQESSRVWMGVGMRGRVEIEQVLEEERRKLAKERTLYDRMIQVGFKESDLATFGRAVAQLTEREQEDFSKALGGFEGMLMIAGLASLDETTKQQKQKMFRGVLEKLCRIPMRKESEEVRERAARDGLAKWEEDQERDRAAKSRSSPPKLPDPDPFKSEGDETEAAKRRREGQPK